MGCPSWMGERSTTPPGTGSGSGLRSFVAPAGAVRMAAADEVSRAASSSRESIRVGRGRNRFQDKTGGLSCQEFYAVGSSLSWIKT